MRLPPGPLSAALNELVGSRLVTEEPGGRLRQEPLLHLHARELAGEEGPLLLGRMADHYVDRAVRAGHALIPQRPWLRRYFPGVELGTDDPAAAERWLREERENLAALVRPTAELGRREQLVLLAVALWPLHERGKHLDDMIALNGCGVEAAEELGRWEIAALLRVQLAFAHMQRGAPEVAHGLARAAVDAATGRDPELEATAVETLGLAPSPSAGTARPWRCCAATWRSPRPSATDAGSRWPGSTWPRCWPRPRRWPCSRPC
ncbi:hypothetical protein BJF78_30695 [Pseudonocardia sp. CNS-139]|nr:hypothetical protein BJF78_30695 [Pseudonocardia sp. CNS-139]